METEKQIAIGVDIFVICALLISLLTADWDWLLGDEGGTILMVVLFAYLLFIGIGVGVSYWAFILKKAKETVPTTTETKQVKFTPIKIFILVFVWLSAILSVVTLLFVPPGEGVINYIIASIFAIIAVVLAIINALQQKK